MYSSVPAVLNIDTTRVLHQDTADIIALREDLRLFIAAHKSYRSLLKRLFPRSNLDQPDGALPDAKSTAEDRKTDRLRLLEDMEDRLQDSQLNLEHQLETSEVIVRQLENLL